MDRFSALLMFTRPPRCRTIYHRWPTASSLAARTESFTSEYKQNNSSDLEVFGHLTEEHARMLKMQVGLYQILYFDSVCKVYKHKHTHARIDKMQKQIHIRRQEGTQIHRNIPSHTVMYICVNVRASARAHTHIQIYIDLQARTHEVAP